MADIAITAANVKQGSNAVTEIVTAGEAVTAGQALYKKSTDSKYYKAQCDGTAEEATVAGFALNGASADQPIVMQKSGQLTIGGTIAAGVMYGLSATAGGVAPLADAVSTNRVSFLGYGVSTSILQVNIINTGQVLA